MRFALKSRRNIPLASEAPKSMRKEIERRIGVVKDIKYEPKLINSEEEMEKENVHPHIHRMKAVDSLKSIEECIVRTTGDASHSRPPGQDVKYYLARNSYLLTSVDQRVIDSFVDSYTHARHEPLPVFGSAEYTRHMDLVNEIIAGICRADLSHPSQLSGMQRRSSQAPVSPSAAKSTSVRSSRGEAIVSETSV